MNASGIVLKANRGIPNPASPARGFSRSVGESVVWGRQGNRLQARPEPWGGPPKSLPRGGAGRATVKARSIASATSPQLAESWRARPPAPGLAAQKPRPTLCPRAQGVRAWCVPSHCCPQRPPPAPPRLPAPSEEIYSPYSSKPRNEGRGSTRTKF